MTDNSPAIGFLAIPLLKGCDQATAEVSANIARINMGAEPRPMNFVQRLPTIPAWRKMLAKGLIWLNRTRN